MSLEPTRASLLQRIRDGQQALAWEDFHAEYSGVIIRYARKLGLNDAQAMDILQETMIELIRVLPKFEYDRQRGRFRNFLLTITHRRILRFFRKQQRRGELSLDAPTPDGTPYGDFLEADPDDSLVEQDEKRWQMSVVEEALDRMRQDPALERTIRSDF